MILELTFRHCPPQENSNKALPIQFSYTMGYTLFFFHIPNYTKQNSQNYFQIFFCWTVKPKAGEHVSPKETSQFLTSCPVTLPDETEAQTRMGQWWAGDSLTGATQTCKSLDFHLDFNIASASPKMGLEVGSFTGSVLSSSQ